MLTERIPLPDDKLQVKDESRSAIQTDDNSAEAERGRGAVAESARSAYFKPPLLPSPNEDRLSRSTEVMLMRRKDRFPLIRVLGVQPEDEAPVGLLKGGVQSPPPGLAVQSGAGAAMCRLLWPGPQIWGKGYTQMSPQ